MFTLHSPVYRPLTSMHVGGWFVAAWWHIGLLNDWHLWGYLPHLYHHYTAVCYADYVDSHKVVCCKCAGEILPLTPCVLNLHLYNHSGLGLDSSFCFLHSALLHSTQTVTPTEAKELMHSGKNARTRKCFCFCFCPLG